MKKKLWRFAAGFLPVCLLSAQPSNPQGPQQANPQAPPQAKRNDIPGPSLEDMRRMDEQRQRTREQAMAMNDLAGHIHSLDDARKLVGQVGGYFSQGLAPGWRTRSIRERVSRAEYEAAAGGALIPEQRVADAWNDYLKKIGAPQEYYATADEIHALRDMKYVSSQVLWARGSQSVWTLPHLYAVGADGKVATGCRAVEALNVLWQLGSQPEILEGTRELIKSGKSWSDMVKNPTQPPAPGTAKGYVTARVAPPNPVRQAVSRYTDEHGARALQRAVKDLLNEVLAG